MRRRGRGNDEHKGKVRVLIFGSIEGAGDGERSKQREREVGLSRKASTRRLHLYMAGVTSQEERATQTLLQVRNKAIIKRKERFRHSGRPTANITETIEFSVEIRLL